MTFNPNENHIYGYGAEGSVYALARRSDGTVLVGGTFTRYNDRVCGRLVRIHPDGRLDSTFNIGTAANNNVWAVTELVDGRLVVGGAFTSFNGTACNRIVRLLADGTVDTTFQTGTGASDGVHEVIEQPDGKLLLVGSFTTFNGVPKGKLVRLLADGAIDTTFVIGTGCNANIQDAWLMADGRILIAGDFYTYNGTNRPGIARLLPDGGLDPSFTVGTGTSNGVCRMFVQSDGRILIGGAFTYYAGVARNRIARLNDDGSLDPTFAPGTGANWDVNVMEVRPDGRILVGGAFSTFNGQALKRIMRLWPDGSIDTTFSIASNPDPNITSKGSPVNMLRIGPDGKILIGGTFKQVAGLARLSLALLNEDGEPDPTFDPGTGFSPTGDVRMVVQPDDKVLVMGSFVGYQGSPTGKFLRLLPNGTLDPGFAPAGTANLSALQPNGKIICTGLAYPDPDLFRLNANGSMDATFSDGDGPNDDVRALLVQPDGKILIAGDFNQYDGTVRVRVARLNTTGTLDPTFNPVLGPDDELWAMVLQPDGKVIIAGAFTSVNGTPRNRIARLHPNGLLDYSFDPGAGANATIRRMALQSDGKVVIAGSFFLFNGTFNGRVARLNADGSLDTGFDTGSGADALVTDVVIQVDGKVVIGGDFTEMNGVPHARIARLLPDGQVDAQFDVGDGCTSFDGYSSVTSLVQQSDHRIIACGDFTSYNSTPRHRIVRISNDIITGTGTSEDASRSVEFFPNPTTGVLHIRIVGPGATGLRLFDISGREVFSLPLGDRQPLFDVDLTDRLSGAYLCVVSTITGPVSKLIVKQ